MKQYIKYKGYRAEVKISLEDNVLYGKIIGIKDLILFEGNTVEELKNAFKESVDDYIDTCKALNKEPQKERKLSIRCFVKGTKTKLPKRLIYPAIFYRCEKEGSYTVEFPDLKGCCTQGDSLSEAMQMAIDAASGWILSTIEDGEDIPTPSHQINLSDYEDPAFLRYILLDIDQYAKNIQRDTEGE